MHPFFSKVARRSLATLGVLGAGLLVAVIGAVGLELVVYGQDPEQIPFDAGRWARASGHTESERRWQMKDDLMENHLALGMDAHRVQRLLGPEDPGDGELDYQLRYRGVTAWAWDVLVVELGPDGLVTDFYVERRGD